VLEAVRAGRIEPVMSWALAEEVVDVLRRPAIRRYGITEGDIDDLLAVFGRLLPDVDVRVPIRDLKDAPVIAAALAGAVPVIVSGDRDLLDDMNLTNWLRERGIAVMTPAQALESLAR
jgi:putative PIN family toxin of toxin-antitoxin system